MDAFILALERSHNTPPPQSEEQNKPFDWVITSDGRCYADDKVYFICRWLNHSFMPFSPKQQMLYEEFRKIYDKLKTNKKEE